MKKLPEKVIVLGSGALKIGEAGEFDYSGTQALKALSEEGVKTVLINPNIATVQTSKGISDKIYFLPVTPHFVEEVIRKEKPDGILLAFGGQTALNCGVELYNKGVFKKYGIKVLGTPVKTIEDTEDRELFAGKLRQIGIKTPESYAVTHTEAALTAAEKMGYPIIVRAAFTLGGQGSGFCKNRKELEKLSQRAFSFSGQILVEESLKGWKEIEYEVVRDRYDNCITVCNMENFDPLGIHTGESIVVAPSQTLNNHEYHKLRSLSIEIVRHLGIIGECNVQYALDPDSEDYRVIEVNARLSRSSALASKATGYPLAFVAAKLAIGYGLHELKNAVTGITTACFEPALDYVVCKIPYWDLNKFPGVVREIGSSMKSVGEVMAIGKCFEEAIQKGLRMVGHDYLGRDELQDEVAGRLEYELTNPTDTRILTLLHALRMGYSVERLWELTSIDSWFLSKLENIIQIEKKLNKYSSSEDIPVEIFLDAKKNGFSDQQIACSVYTDYLENPEDKQLAVRIERKKSGIVPYVKQIDTMAAEYPAVTNYLYMTYSGIEHDIEFRDDKKSIVVLGSGAYRIGSSVEFDWCSVNALETVNKQDFRSVMINYNPETVSTDYDVCDRLYFDELNFERVMDIIELENPGGVIVSVGGQIPNNLAVGLHKSGVKVIGTSPENIDMAENRQRFSAMLDDQGIDQPRWKELSSIEDIHAFIEEVGFPVLIRPSYVLSGAAMNVVSNKEELGHYLSLAVKVSRNYPVVISEFMEQSNEIEFDGVSKEGDIISYAISEHVEFAGVHSGDATLVFPPRKLDFQTIRNLRRIASKIASALNICGPFNIQLLEKNGILKVIECNLRASRSFPFVSKVMNYNMIDAATRVMLGHRVSKREAPSFFEFDHIGVKASQFSFSRLLKADPVLGVDMSSTGEVGCMGKDYHDAMLKAMLSVGYKIPQKNILISSGDILSKFELLKSCKMLIKKGFKIFATKGTSDFLEEHNIESEVLHWPDEDKKPNTLDYIRDKKISLVINIPKNLSQNELNNDYSIRRSAIDYNIPLITNTRLASTFIDAVCRKEYRNLDIKSWDEYQKDRD